MRANLEHLISLVKQLNADTTTLPNRRRIDRLESDHKHRTEAVREIERELGIWPRRNQ